jgi:uncharacterized membrane protein
MSLLRATALGFASGGRTFAGPAALVLRGRSGNEAVLLLALGEVTGDKTPWVPPRTGAGPLVGRAYFGARAGGAATRSPAGTIAGGVAAVAGAFAFSALRAALTERAGIPNAAAGLVEDAVVYGIALAAAGR